MEVGGQALQEELRQLVFLHICLACVSVVTLLFVVGSRTVLLQTLPAIVVKAVAGAARRAHFTVHFHVLGFEPGNRVVILEENSFKSLTLLEAELGLHNFHRLQNVHV